jgi:hypothetical protein
VVASIATGFDDSIDPSFSLICEKGWQGWQPRPDSRDSTIFACHRQWQVMARLPANLARWGALVIPMYLTPHGGGEISPCIWQRRQIVAAFLELIDLNSIARR